MPCVCLWLDHSLQRAIQASLGRHYRAVQGKSDVYVGDIMSVCTLDFRHISNKPCHGRINGWQYASG